MDSAWADDVDGSRHRCDDLAYPIRVSPDQICIALVGVKKWGTIQGTPAFSHLSRHVSKCGADDNVDASMVADPCDVQKRQN